MPIRDMKGQVVLITGSSSGIGRETAYRFAQAGAKLVLTYNRGKSRGEQAEGRCRKLGAGDVLLVHLDVMNNGGVGFFVPFADQTFRDIETQVRTNLEGMMKMTSVFLPHVRKGIVNIASAAGKTAYEEMTVYCGTKFGVRGFTQALAQEYPSLRICCVNPDMTATRLTGNEGRPASEVAEVIFRTVSGAIKVPKGGDVDVWEVMKSR
ncbi:MAG: SDR family oxidoreductase [Nitrospirota bacterium]